MIIYGHVGVITAPDQVPNELLVQWAKDRLPGIEDFGRCVTIGIVRDGKICAVAVYNKYLPPNIEGTFVTDKTKKWESPRAAGVMLSYPFFVGCKRITATVAAENTPMHNFLLRLGFVQEGYHPDALPSGDAVTFGLYRSNAERWIRLGLKHEQTFRAAAA